MVPFYHESLLSCYVIKSGLQWVNDIAMVIHGRLLWIVMDNGEWWMWFDCGELQWTKVDYDHSYATSRHLTLVGSLTGKNC